MAAKSSKEAAWARGEFQGDLRGFGWTLHAQAGQEPAQQEYLPPRRLLAYQLLYNVRLVDLRVVIAL